MILALLCGCGDDGGGDATSGPAETSESGDSEPTGGHGSSGHSGSSSGSSTEGGSTSEGSGSSSSGSAGETAATVPAAPSDLSVAMLGAGGHLTWTDNSDNEDEFVIMRAQDDGAAEELARVPFDTATYHDEPLESGSTYTWVVHATNAAGMSEPSNEATLTVP